jgi:hypothetical protein
MLQEQKFEIQAFLNTLQSSSLSKFQQLELLLNTKYIAVADYEQYNQEYINTRVYSSLYVCVDMCYYIFNNKLSIVTSHAIRPSFEGNLC